MNYSTASKTSSPNQHKKSLNARSRINLTGFLVQRQNCYIILGSKMKPSRNIWKKETKPLYMHYDEPEPTSNAWNDKQKEIGNATMPTNVRLKTSNKTQRPHGTLLSKSWGVSWATSKPIIQKNLQRMDETKLQQSPKKMQISWRNTFKMSLTKKPRLTQPSFKT